MLIRKWSSRTIPMGAATTLLVLMLATWACETDENEDVHDSFNSSTLESPHPITDGIRTEESLWAGVLAYFIGYPDLCSASLIHPRILLTVTHCLVNPSKDRDYTQADEMTALAVVGGSDVRFDPSALAGVVDIAYREDVDLALILLDSPLDLPTYCLRNGPAAGVEETGTIVGYGRTVGDDPSSYGIRRYGQTTIQARHPEENVLELGNPTASCDGDSGGPFFTEVDGEWLVTGVCDNGLVGCPSTGAYYTDILPFIDWIDETALAWVGTKASDSCTATQADGTISPPKDDTVPPKNTNANSQSCRFFTGDSVSWVGDLLGIFLNLDWF